MFYKRTIPLILVFVMGLLLIAQYYSPHPVSEQFMLTISIWLQIIGGFGLALGVYSLVHVHYLKIKRMNPGWGYSVILYVCIILTIFVGWYSKAQNKHPNGLLTSFGWTYTYMLSTLQASMFSLLAFFIASAAFRAFRAKTLEATVLLITATIVMIGRVPLGEYLFGETVGEMTNWILRYPNMAAKRAIIIGISLGVIATSLKIIFGIERSYLGGGKD